MTVIVGDILQNKCPTPFTSRPSWKRSQQDCGALKRTFAHLSQGTRPSKKSKRMSDVKRYLNVATLSRDGLLVVKKSQPFMRTRDLIVIPRSVLPGLLTALHLRLQHPSKSQLHRVFHRSFYALDADNMINMITSSCAQCADGSCYEEHEQLTDSEDSNQSEYNTSEEDEADRPCDEVGRRQRRQPAWMQSGDWDLS